MNKLSECPVCGKGMSNSICDKCGYTQFIFPEVVPAHVQRFEQKRVQIMRRVRSGEGGSVSAVGMAAAAVRPTVSDEIVGTLIVRNLVTDLTAAYPVRKGYNVYGGDDGKTCGQEYINPLEIGVNIPGRAFEIVATSTGCKVCPQNNFVLSYNRHRITDEMDLESDDYFFHSNLLGFHVVMF